MLFTQVVHFRDELKIEPLYLIDPGDASESFGVDVPYPFVPTSAVHENIVLSALIYSDAKLAPTTTYSNATVEAREYLRVVLWNDDPAVLFFEDDDDDNWNFTLGGVKNWYCDHFK